MTELRLVIFDVDGTLVDSQGDILASMTAAFESEGIARPSRSEVLAIVGLSLPEAMARLVPDADTPQRSRMVDAYKDSYAALRQSAPVSQTSPLFPGARAAIEALWRSPNVLLAVATGKSKRGLDKLVEGHGLTNVFASMQVADFHPSKPHPSMVEACLAETGVAARNAVMIGDTTFDMEMGQAGGVGTIGVGWGYHPAEALHRAGANAVLGSFDQLAPYLSNQWSMTLG